MTYSQFVLLLGIILGIPVGFALACLLMVHIGVLKWSHKK